MRLLKLPYFWLRVWSIRLMMTRVRLAREKFWHTFSFVI